MTTVVVVCVCVGGIWEKQLKKCSRNVLRSQENVVCVLAHGQQSSNNGAVAIVNA